MLKQRIITALLLAPIAILGIFFLPITGLAIVLTVILCIAAHEWANFISPDFSRRLPLTIAIIAVWIVGFAVFPLSALSVSRSALLLFKVAGIFWILAFILVLSYPRTVAVWGKNSVIKFIAGLLVLLPFGWSMLSLRGIDPTQSWRGAGWVLYVFLLVWAADTGAYFTGRKFGRIKMAAQVSPKKTIEGLIGGLVLSMLVCAVSIFLFKPRISSVAVFAACSLLTTVASVLGDLLESMFKREAGIKDSGSILPGHGGILDRIDSLTAAVPVFTLCYLMWIHP
ncbi:phosphatidate cytidylyltransferase [Celerinatantimonas sp. YJH-8]|uniref:phosphatidate cytidylyltransferase n=1 Tax=Celerinatantimonas sp. YJH-8 TaxID=3228714 RepID=UPI0038BE9910